MKARFVPALLAFAFALAPLCAADKPTDKEITAAKEELQKLAEFVGPWTINAEDSAKKPLGKEKWDWSWKFAKETAPALVAKVADSKTFSAATITYDAKAKGFKAVVADAKGTELEYAAAIDKKGVFVLTRTDEKSKDVHTVKMSTAAEGIRLNVQYEVQAGGKGLASTTYKASGNKDGESLAGGAKKAECIVTGGAATISVTVNGKEYKVCCSGCADELKANPDKYIKKK